MKYLLLVLLLTGCYSRESDEATKAVNGLTMSVKILECTVKVTDDKSKLRVEAERCREVTKGNTDFCLDHIKMYMEQLVVKCLQDNH